MLHLEEGYSGVPQGFFLGPVLFIIYVNDIPGRIESYCKYFADDSKVYTAVGKKSDQERLQRDRIKLSQWSKIWLLEFSIQKCKVIEYGNVKWHFDCKLCDKDGNLLSLPKDTIEKDLSIWFQDNMKYDNKHTW